jgi:hypothetical protein
VAPPANQRRDGGIAPTLARWLLHSHRRSIRINQNTSDYFEIGDRADLVYEEKLERYGQLADACFQAEEFEEFSSAAVASSSDG